jgi:hypothetical protein
MPAGRPIKYTAAELQTKVNEYFEVEPKPTIAGLAVHVGVERKTLYNYKEQDELLHIVKEAIARIESKYEGRLIYENNPTGVIFALKNMGWRDKVEQDVRVEGGVKLIFQDADSNDKENQGI